MALPAPGSAAAGPEIGAMFDALGAGDRIALAVSGGPDSLALLLLAHAARPARIVAVTVDHGLRAEAAGEAAMVARICRDLGVPHATLPVTVEPGRVGLQAAARAARYRALGAWALSGGVRILATAHHLDDQAETLLMRLARGSGLTGLTAIRASRPLAEAPGVTLIRPLLGWRKAALAEVVDRAGLTPIDDPANRDPRHDRTAVRALMAREPLLDPARLGASARALGDAEAAVAWCVARLAAERLRANDEGWTIDIADLPRDLRRRLLARVVTEARGERVAHLMDRLEHGLPGTLGTWLVRPDGAQWRAVPAPARRPG